MVNNPPAPNLLKRLSPGVDSLPCLCDGIAPASVPVPAAQAGLTIPPWSKLQARSLYHNRFRALPFHMPSTLDLPMPHALLPQRKGALCGGVVVPHSNTVGDGWVLQGRGGTPPGPAAWGFAACRSTCVKTPWAV